MEIYSIYQMKALNELVLLAKVLPSMSVQFFIINNWNQYTKSDQTMVKFLFWLSCKVGEMSLMPFWFSPLVLIVTGFIMVSLYFFSLLQIPRPKKHWLWIWSSAIISANIMTPNNTCGLSKIAIYQAQYMYIIMTRIIPVKQKVFLYTYTCECNT